MRRDRAKSVILASCLLPLAIVASFAQQSPDTREHLRIPRTEVPGRRVELKSLKGAVLFVGPNVKPERSVPLIVHFHGASWLIEYHAANIKPTAALITVQLGALSSAYGRPFENRDIFDALIEEARRELNPKHGFISITLSGFSAGYGAIRAILRDEKHFARVNNVLLLDGIHAGYSTDGTTVVASDLDSFEKFARSAARGKKQMVITHSDISPGTYASTTECTDYLLRSIGLRRKSERRSDSPNGMDRMTTADKRGFHVRGYAGSIAADHADHLYSIGEWLGLLKL